MSQAPRRVVSRQEIMRKIEQEQEGESQATSSAAPRDWQSLIEEQIARLDLDNLPNRGRPLNLEDNPYADPSEDAAHRLIKHAGYTLPWIEEGHRIDRELVAARYKLEQARAEYLELRDAQICAGHQWVEGTWLAAVREFKQQVNQINRQIRDYNLKVPAASLQKFSVRVAEELAHLGVDDEA
jgi:DnaJ family protein C protein 28